ncbi:MAG: hypothetical protein LBV43_14310 [Prevotella sp.]|nr:hypothetical protein [Prevotella sp.]
MEETTSPQPSPKGEGVAKPQKKEIKTLRANSYQLMAKNCYFCYFLVKIRRLAVGAIPCGCPDV